MIRGLFRWLPHGRQWGLLLFVIFIGDLFVEPYRRGASSLEWVLTVIGVTIFVCLFVTVVVLRDRQLLWIVAADVVLGVMFVPFNSAASLFFVYAASFVPFAFRGRPLHAGVTIVLVVAIIGIESWLITLPPGTLGTAIGYSLIIGSANVWVSQQAIVSERLRLAHDEIEHLAKAAERERIARDLHDVLGHTLSVVALKAELAARLITMNPTWAQAEIDGVSQVSREALSQLREAVRGYRTDGLVAEIGRARSVLEEAGILVECHTIAAGLTASQDNVLALVVREAVTNVIRHAKANRCLLTLEDRDGFYRLVIQDDGRGGVHASGLGMRGMIERVEAIGGSTVIEDREGVKLAITIPRSGSEDKA